jgi:uncharacterized protein
VGDSRNTELNLAVIGTGISGLAAAWLLNQRHRVTVYETAARIGGHCNTVDVPDGDGTTPVDTGFIVYNEPAYPNLTALFKYLDVPTEVSDMSFAVSLDGGGLEYSGANLTGLFAQKRNVFRPRFWSMLTDIRRFYREAPNDVTVLDELHTTLGDYLDMRSYSRAFRDDHLLPMAGAIWSAPPGAMLGYPAASFIRFHDNHGLLQVFNRPQWRTVTGGSRAYVERLVRPFRRRVRIGTGAKRLHRRDGRVAVMDHAGRIEWFDGVVIAAHADSALAMLDDPSADERALLGAFRYSKNAAVLHRDPSLMPRRRAVWSSWNYVGAAPSYRGAETCTVTYWMNRLQNIASPSSLFVTLNPHCEPDPRTVLAREMYEHPMFDAEAMRTQRRLWSLQGRRNTWFCGSYFGSGFHEDGLQSGLAVAEALGGVRRPWSVANESGRIFVTDGAPASQPLGAAA